MTEQLPHADKKLARTWAKQWTVPQLVSKFTQLERNSYNAPTAAQRDSFAKLMQTAALAVCIRQDSSKSPVRAVLAKAEER